MLRMPSAASATNHSTITGPKARPTVSVPKRWVANSSTSTPMRERQHPAAAGAAQRPRVLRRRRAPKSPASARRRRRTARRRTRRGCRSHRSPASSAASVRCASAVSAMMPPSPSLSARMITGDVLHGDHDHQRPEHQRQDAEHGGVVRRESVVRRERFLDRVQRAGADVAEHHADRTQHQRTQARLAGAFDVRMDGRRRGCRNAHGLDSEPAAIVRSNDRCPARRK